MSKLSWKQIQKLLGEQAHLTGSISISGSIEAYSLAARYLDLEPLTNGDYPTHKPGRIIFDLEDGTVGVFSDINEVVLQSGQEFWIRGFNNSGTPIANGTPVFISGSRGDRPYIWKSISQVYSHETGRVFHNHIVGLATHTIAENTVGIVTAKGLVRGVDTSTFAPGDILYVSTEEGNLTNVAPEFPYEIIQVGFVIRSHTNGIIFVEPKEPTQFANISGLSGSKDPKDKELWVYNKSTEGWYNTKSNLELSGSFSGSFEGKITDPGVVRNDAEVYSGSVNITNIVNLSQEQYDLIVSPNPQTLYIIT